MFRNGLDLIFENAIRYGSVPGTDFLSELEGIQFCTNLFFSRVGTRSLICILVFSCSGHLRKAGTLIFKKERGNEEHILVSIGKLSSRSCAFRYF